MSSKDRGYLLRAACYLARARLEFGLRDARSIISDLGQENSTVMTTPLSSYQTTLGNCYGGAMHGVRQRHCDVDPRLVGWSIEAVARRVPWRSDCLIQSMAAAQWLRTHGLEPALHLGVTRAEDKGLMAHAWLSLDGEVIVGGSSGASEYFVPIQILAREMGRRTRALRARKTPTD